jgi:hypothetical protein
MDNRMIDFIAALRAAGVRISVAESADALRAVEQIGITDKARFRSALQATVIKESRDIETFLHYFPLYFGFDQPPMQQPGGGGSMSEQEQHMMQQMLQHMLEQMTPQQLAELFNAMMSGQHLSQQQIREMLMQGSLPAMPATTNPAYQSWMARRAMREMNFNQLEQALQQLLQQLREAGVSEQALQEIEQAAQQNRETLAEQIEQQVGRHMAEQMQERQPGKGTRPEESLMEQPFERLSTQEVDDLRRIVTRLAARLRSRAALRQRRGKTGNLDVKSTIRTNMRFGSVPMIIRHRRRHLKPKMTVLCDLSYSMRPVASFTLLLIYALQDQVSRTRSFAYIHDLEDISNDFAEAHAEQALETIQDRIHPPGSYATDLGNSLKTFVRDYMSCVDSRTTVIILGDGRNNYRNPNLAAFEEISRRARKVLWFNPEPQHMWGVEYPDTLNSDMLEYARMCDAVHEVGNLRQLIAAIDTLFVR